MITTRQLNLASMAPSRNYMLQWLPKYRTLAKPQYFDNVHRRNDSALKNRNYTYFAQDPLHFDHNIEHINGGI